MKKKKKKKRKKRIKQHLKTPGTSSALVGCEVLVRLGKGGKFFSCGGGGKTKDISMKNIGVEVVSLENL